MMISEPNSAAMSIEEYLALDRASLDVRYEYIDGVVTMLAGGSANHSRISVNITSQLYIALRNKSCQVFNSDLKVSISAERFVYPDVSVSCDARDQAQGSNDIIQHPCIIFEVLSPSTEAYDRTKKFMYYRECSSVKEIVFVNTQEQAVDLYRRAHEKLWVLHLFRRGDDVELKSIHVSIPIEAIYEKIRF